MNSTLLRILLVLVPCGLLPGCSSADNPTMVKVEAPKIEPNTATPKTRGSASEPYGASKKYKEMMNNR